MNFQNLISLNQQWQQATTQRQTTRTKTGFSSITPTSVLRAWQPEEQFHPIWKEGSNTALPGTSEPWNSVAVFWVYTHTRTCSFFYKENLRAINSWRKLQDPVLLHTWLLRIFFFPCTIEKFHVFASSLLPAPFADSGARGFFIFFARLSNALGDESKLSLWHCKAWDSIGLHPVLH